MNARQRHLVTTKNKGDLQRCYLNARCTSKGRVLRGSVELPLVGRELLPHADKLMFVYVLELCKSEAKRAAPFASLLQSKVKKR
jgi:hypothetical protein